MWRSICTAIGEVPAFGSCVPVTVEIFYCDKCDFAEFSGNWTLDAEPAGEGGSQKRPLLPGRRRPSVPMTVAMLKAFVNRAAANAEHSSGASLVFDALNGPPDQFVHYIIHSIANLNDERTMLAVHASDVRRQIVDRQCRRIAAKRGALDDVQQLSDVAGPSIARQRGHALIIDALDRPAQLFDRLTQELLNQKRQVLDPVSQRREVNQADVQAMEQVFPKALRPNLAFKVLIRRRQWPYPF